MSETSTSKPFVLVAVTDLIFAVKIRSTATSLGLNVVIAESLESFSATLNAGRPLGVIVDLEASFDSPTEAVAEARRWGDASSQRPPPIHAYCSHVRADLMTEAEQAGADSVMPRSRFSAELAAILQRFSQSACPDATPNHP